MCLQKKNLWISLGLMDFFGIAGKGATELGAATSGLSTMLSGLGASLSAIVAVCKTFSDNYGDRLPGIRRCFFSSLLLIVNCLEVEGPVA